MNQMEKPAQGETIAVMHTSMGDISLRLFGDKAPKAVENFMTHAENGYYNGLTFHRVIQDFMIQGGDPTGTGAGGDSIWGSPFEDEFDVDLRNYRGALSMANAGPHTNGSQFFIVQAGTVPDGMLSQMEELTEQGYPAAVTAQYRVTGGTPWLDFRHTVFGQVFHGMEIVDAIAATPVGEQDKPLTDVVIESIEIKAYGG